MGKIGRPCEGCRLPQPRRAELDAALMVHAAGYQAVADRFGLSYGATRRHAIGCLARECARSKEVTEMLNAENLLAKLGEWHDRMQDQYHKADVSGEIMAAVATARTGIQAIESFSRLGPMGALEARIAALENPSQEDSEEADGADSTGADGAS